MTDDDVLDDGRPLEELGELTRYDSDEEFLESFGPEMPSPLAPGFKRILRKARKTLERFPETKRENLLARSGSFERRRAKNKAARKSRKGNR